MAESVIKAHIGPNRAMRRRTHMSKMRILAREKTGGFGYSLKDTRVKKEKK